MTSNWKVYLSYFLSNSSVIYKTRVNNFKPTIKLITLCKIADTLKLFMIDNLTVSIQGAFSYKFTVIDKKLLLVLND